MAKRDKQPNQMKSGERKWFHLVEFSKGKPNEISFSVLDKLADDPQEKKGIFGGRFSRNRGSSEFLSAEDFASLSSGSSSNSNTGIGFDGQTEKLPVASSLDSGKGEKRGKVATRAKHGSNTSSHGTGRVLGGDSSVEISRRKNKRRSITVVSVLIIALICVIGIGAAGSYLYQKHLEEMSNLELLQEGFKEVEEADKTIVGIDVFLSSPHDENTVAKANEFIQAIPQAKSHLGKANDFASRANKGLNGSTEDKQASEYALSAIVSRQTLLDVSEKLVREELLAKETIDSLNEAEEKIKQAEGMLDQSAQIIANTTPETVAKSTELTAEAKTLFEEAHQLAQVAVDNYGSNVAGVYTAYTGKRIECCEAALNSNAAILLQDRQTAESYNSQYNELDKEIAELAAAFTSSYYQPIIAAYDLRVAELKEKYQNLRNDVATNDAHLRSYLGTDSQNQ